MQAELKLLRLRSVLERSGLSRSETYRRMAIGEFPMPVSIGRRAVAWPEHLISKWIAERIAEGRKPSEDQQ